MSNVQMRTVIIYNKRRITPETVDAIVNARDGEFVGLEPEQFSSIMELHFFDRESNKLQRADEKARPRTEE